MASESYYQNRLRRLRGARQSATASDQRRRRRAMLAKVVHDIVGHSPVDNGTHQNATNGTQENGTNVVHHGTTRHGINAPADAPVAPNGKDGFEGPGWRGVAGRPPNRIGTGGRGPGGFGPGGNRPPRPPPGNMYLDIARRWWRQMAVVAVIGALATGAYVRFGPTTYQSTAVLSVNNADSSRDADTKVANLAAQAGSPAVLQLASKALGDSSPTGAPVPGAAAPAEDQSGGIFPSGWLLSPSPDSMRVTVQELRDMAADKRISIQPERSGHLIDVTVTDNDPGRAQTLANTIANVFVDSVNTKTQRDGDDHRAALQEGIDKVKEALRVASLFDQQTALTTQLQAERSQYLSLAAPKAVPASAGTAAPAPANPVVGSPELVQQAKDDQASARSSIADLTTQLRDVQRQESDLLDGVSPFYATSLGQQQQDLRAREQDLLKTQPDLQARILSLQTTYQTEQGQAAQATSGGNATVPIFNNPDAIARARWDTLQLTRTQLEESRQNLTNLQQQRAANKTQLDALPPIPRVLPNPVPDFMAQQIQQVKDLQATDASLASQIPGEENRLLSLQESYQKQLEASAGATTSTTSTTTSADAAAAHADMAALLKSQIDDLNQNLTSVNQRLAQTRASLASAMEAFDPDTAQRLRDFQTQETSVRSALEAQQAKLLKAQQTLSQVNPPVASGARVAAGPADAADSQASAEISTDLIRELERRIADDTQQLNDVRAEIDALPGKPDLAVTAARVAAYKNQLTQMAAELAQLDVTVTANVDPITLSGDASAPKLASSTKKPLGLGGAGTAAAALGVAGLLELLRRRRLASKASAAAARAASKAATPAGASR